MKYWGIMKNETCVPMEPCTCCFIKTEACCVHTNSVHNTFKFLQCDILLNLCTS